MTDRFGRAREHSRSWIVKRSLKRITVDNAQLDPGKAPAAVRQCLSADLIQAVRITAQGAGDRVQLLARYLARPSELLHGGVTLIYRINQAGPDQFRCDRYSEGLK